MVLCEESADKKLGHALDCGCESRFAQIYTSLRGLLIERDYLSGVELIRYVAM